MKIDLHIEELVLEGFPSSDRHRIGAAVERELTRLLAERGLPPGLLSHPEVASLKGGAFEIGKGPSAEKIGQAVAQSVYRGWNL